MSNDVLNEKKEELEPEKENNLNTLLPGAVSIEKPSKDDEPYEQVIERARLDFMKRYSAGRRNSFIAMGVVMALAVASVICITMSAVALKIVGWLLVGVAVVGSLTYYIVTRNGLPNATKKYIDVVNREMNKRNYADTRFSEVTTDKTEKLELSDPISDGIYKGLNNIASRNVINGKFDHRTFRVGDMGLYVGGGRDRKSAFVGKYITYPNDLHFEGRFIISLKGAVPLDLPTDIDDLVVLQEKDNVIIYGKEGAKFKSDLGEKFLKKIESVKVEKHLLNVNVVVWSGHSSIYASFDDEVMTLPYQKPYENGANEQFADNLLAFMDALSEIAEKGK